MKKQVYESPKTEIVLFTTQDVITVSDGSSSDADIPVESEQPMLPWD